MYWYNYFGTIMTTNSSIDVSTLKQLFMNVECSVLNNSISAPKESYDSVVEILINNNLCWDEISDYYGTDFNITSILL